MLWVNRLRMFSSVKAPSAVWKAPTIRRPVGSSKNKKAKRKKGTTPSHARDMGSRRDRAAGRGDVATESSWLMRPRLRQEELRRGAGRPARRNFRAGVVGTPARKDYFTLLPTTASHCFVMTSLALACWSSVGKTALS